ncbi:hypothetical protein BJ742DRAFT_912901 [Cladochytrium replicatum]|nr:hypothetical protein BJ742DRAFT_912901 [Cladochytrium replicatum]
MSRKLRMQRAEISLGKWFYKTQRNTGEQFLVATEQENGAIFRAASIPLSYNRGHAPDLEQFLTAAWAARTVTRRVATACKDRLLQEIATGTHEQLLFRVGTEEQAANYEAERITRGAISVNNDFAPNVWGDPNDVWCSKCWDVGHFRDGCTVTGGSLPPDFTLGNILALKAELMLLNILEDLPPNPPLFQNPTLRAQITEQEATVQGLHTELATLRGHANEVFAAIHPEIEAVRNGIADAVATAVQSETQKILEDARNGREEQERYLNEVWRTQTQFSKFSIFQLANLAAADGRRRSCAGSPEDHCQELSAGKRQRRESSRDQGGPRIQRVYNEARKWAPNPQDKRVGALRVHEMGNFQRWRAVGNSVGEQNCQGRTQYCGVWPQKGIPCLESIGGECPVDAKEWFDAKMVWVRFILESRAGSWWLGGADTKELVEGGQAAIRVCKGSYRVTLPRTGHSGGSYRFTLPRTGHSGEWLSGSLRGVNTNSLGHYKNNIMEHISLREAVLASP